MSTSDPSTTAARAPAEARGPGPAPGTGGGGDTGGEPGAPPVVAVVVAHGASPGLEATLRSLAAQEYPALSVLVLGVDAPEDLARRVATDHPGAFVRRVEVGNSFAAAANEVLGVVQGSQLLLFCHDDVELDPGAVRVLVQEAFRSNAGIVGPKVVAAGDRRSLLEVGESIDRFAAPHPYVEPGERDQEQHDAVRDVFAVSSTTMLVRFDLFEELAGFDRTVAPCLEAVDLCWRARVAGARIVVAPDAVVAHAATSPEDRTGPDDRPREYERQRLRTFLKNYSLPSMLWLVPFALVLSAAEGVAFLFTRRRSRASAVLAAWWWALRTARSIRAQRREVAEMRRVPDRELRYLQVRGSARAARYLNARIDAEARLAVLGEAGREAVESASSRARTPIAIGVGVLLAAALLGGRELVTGTVPSVGTLLPWTGVSELFGSFTSGWRYSGLGAAAPAPTAFAVLGSGAGLLLGDVALARTAVVVLSVPVGIVTMYRFVRPRSPSAGPAFAAALAYGVVPVARNAIAAGDLGALVLYAFAPSLLFALLRAGGMHPNGAQANDTTDARRALLRLAVLTALVGAIEPVTLVLVPALALALVLATPVVGGARLAFRSLAASVGAVVGALVLLLPWPLAFTDGGLDVLGRSASVEGLELVDVLRFHTGPFGNGWLEWGLLAAAAFPLLVATGRRLRWAGRAWVLALLGWAFVWVPARFGGDVLVPAPEVLLIPAALGLALAVGVGVAAFVDDLPRFGFGWRQPAAVAAAIALAMPALAFVGAAAGGRWELPGRGWDEVLGFLDAEAEQAGFRMLWVGAPEALPLQPWTVDVEGTNVAYGTTRDGTGDVRALWPVGDGGATGLLGEALDQALRGETARLGHLLAPMGVRYLLVPERDAPEGASAPAPDGLVDALDRQRDLARQDVVGELTLYENEVWVPLRAVVPADALPEESPEPARAGLTVEPGAVARPVRGPRSGSAPIEAGTVLWAEAYDDEWSASVDGESLEHVETFGWANGFVAPEGGSVDLGYGGQTTRYLLVLGQTVLWVALAVVWIRIRRGPRRGRGEHVAGSDA